MRLLACGLMMVLSAGACARDELSDGSAAKVLPSDRGLALHIYGPRFVAQAAPAYRTYLDTLLRRLRDKGRLEAFKHCLFLGEAELAVSLEGETLFDVSVAWVARYLNALVPLGLRLHALQRGTEMLATALVAPTSRDHGIRGEPLDCPGFQTPFPWDEAGLVNALCSAEAGAGASLLQQITALAPAVLLHAPEMEAYYGAHSPDCRGESALFHDVRAAVVSDDGRVLHLKPQRDRDGIRVPIKAWRHDRPTASRP